MAVEIDAIPTTKSIGWTDALLTRLAANSVSLNASLALRNGATPCGITVANTYTSGSVYERGFMRWASNVLEIGTEHSGGSARDVMIKAGSVSMSFSSTGILTAPILTSLSGNIYMAETRWSRRGSGVVLLDGGSGIASIMMGGLTSAFPALTRSSDALHARLADGSGFAPFESSNLIAHGYLGGTEITDPGAAATNGFRLYLENNGSGKSRLMVRFQSGVAQQLAIEP